MNLSAKKTNVNSKKKTTRNIIIILACVVLAVALFFLGAVIAKYARGRQHNKIAQEMYNPSSVESKPDVWAQPQEELTEEGISMDFETLHKVNPDVIGWISIPNTKLDLPVAQCDNNYFYLDKSIEKKDNPFGVPFVDYKATIVNEYQSSNITIYGHAAKDGTYFAAVKNYKDVEYYKQHPLITFNTIYGKGEYKIIGAFMEDVRISNPKIFPYHMFVDMEDETKMNEFVDSVLKRSYFTTDVDVKPKDHFITLSTCDTELDSSLTTPYRMVLVARKIRDGEKTTVDVSKAQANTEMIMPDGWMDKKGKQNPYK